MPSKYGFETETDRFERAAHNALPPEARPSPSPLDEQVHDVIDDYTRAVCPGDHLIIIRAPHGRAWAAGSVGDSFDSHPLRVVLNTDTDAVTALEVWCVAGHGSALGKQIDRLRDALQAATGHTVVVRTGKDEHAVPSRGPHAEPTVAHD
jgi:hypothetical protein